MSEPKYISTHAPDIQKLLITQFSTDPGMTGLAAVFGAKVQELEDALWALYTQRSIDYAIGAQLDLLGKIVGYPRQGLDDNTYRIRVRAKIAVNESSGTTSQILQIFALLLPSNGLVLRDTFPGGFELAITGVIPGIAVSELSAILTASRGACIESQLVYSTTTVANTFTYDGTTAQAYDTGLYAGSI